MKTLTNKSGLTGWEITLFAIFLSVAFGSSIFFFLLGSYDMQTADKTHAWILKINDKLDKVREETANAAEVIHPFCRDSNECFFRVYDDMNMLALSPKEEGFMFKDGKLFYVLKPLKDEAQGSEENSVLKPIIEGCKKCVFSRLGPNLIELYIEAVQSSNTKAVPFRRLIKLRN